MLTAFQCLRPCNCRSATSALTSVPMTVAVVDRAGVRSTCAC